MERKRRGEEGWEQRKENYKKRERTRWGRWSKRQVREKEVTTGDSGMRASSRLTCIQRFDPPRASLLLSLSLYSLSPPAYLDRPPPQRQSEIKTGFHFPLHSSVVSFFSFFFFFLFFLSFHFFLFLDHYNTVRRIPVPAWLNPIIYSFLRVESGVWRTNESSSDLLLYNRMRRVRL